MTTGPVVGMIASGMRARAVAHIREMPGDRAELERFLSASSLALSLSACTTVTTPSERITLAITRQPDVLLVGASVPLTVTNAATGAVVEPRWSTSDPAVAVVSLGQLRALRAGVATIGALYQASNVTFIVKVVPNFAGTYDGTMFIVDVCFFDRGVCRPPPFPPSPASPRPERFIARWTQVKDVVSGTLSFPDRTGTYAGPIQGQIDTTGRLAVTGRLTHNIPVVFIDLDEWSTFLNEAGTQMFGSVLRRFMVREMDRDVPQSISRVELRGIDRVP